MPAEFVDGPVEGLAVAQAEARSAIAAPVRRRRRSRRMKRTAGHCVSVTSRRLIWASKPLARLKASSKASKRPGDEPKPSTSPLRTELRRDQEEALAALVVADVAGEDARSAARLRPAAASWTDRRRGWRRADSAAPARRRRRPEPDGAGPANLAGPSATEPAGRGRADRAPSRPPVLRRPVEPARRGATRAAAAPSAAAVARGPPAIRGHAPGRGRRRRLPGRDLRHRGDAVAGLRLEHPLEQRPHAGVDARQVGHLPALLDHLDLAAAHVERAAGQRLRQDEPEAVDVGFRPSPRRRTGRAAPATRS